jgi:hypothetical protein
VTTLQNLGGYAAYMISFFSADVSLMLLICIMLISLIFFAVIENSLAEPAARLDASEGIVIIHLYKLFNFSNYKIWVKQKHLLKEK